MSLPLRLAILSLVLATTTALGDDPNSGGRTRAPPSMYFSASRAIDINSLLSAEAVEGVEVYRSAMSAPMEFRVPGFGAGDFFCGVIAVWSRPTARGQMTLKRAFFASMLVGASLLMTEILR